MVTRRGNEFDDIQLVASTKLRIRVAFFSSPPRKRGPRATGAVPAALDARFRGHDGEWMGAGR
jgi:hypothetical protein